MRKVKGTQQVGGEMGGSNGMKGLRTGRGGGGGVVKLGCICCISNRINLLLNILFET